jgi:hypothetical protein
MNTEPEFNLFRFLIELSNQEYLGNIEELYKKINLLRGC